MIQSKSGTITIISFVVDDDKKTSWTGIVSSMRFRSKKTGNATLKYGITLNRHKNELNFMIIKV